MAHLHVADLPWCWNNACPSYGQITRDGISIKTSGGRQRHLFPKNVLPLVINALIFSKLFYCSTVWSGTSKQNINKLQLVQNFAATILTGVKKYDVSPALKELGWLSNERLLQLWDVTMVFKCVNIFSANIFV